MFVSLRHRRREFGRDAASRNTIDPVAEPNLVHFRRIPDEGAAARRLLADDRVDFLLGTDVHGRASDRPSGRSMRRVAVRGRRAPSAGSRRKARG